MPMLHRWFSDSCESGCGIPGWRCCCWWFCFLCFLVCGYLLSQHKNTRNVQRFLICCSLSLRLFWHTSIHRKTIWIITDHMWINHVSSDESNGLPQKVCCLFQCAHCITGFLTVINIQSTWSLPQLFHSLCRKPWTPCHNCLYYWVHLVQLLIALLTRLPNQRDAQQKQLQFNLIRHSSFNHIFLASSISFYVPNIFCSYLFIFQSVSCCPFACGRLAFIFFKLFAWLDIATESSAGKFILRNHPGGTDKSTRYAFENKHLIYFSRLQELHLIRMSAHRIV